MSEYKFQDRTEAEWLELAKEESELAATGVKQVVTTDEELVKLIELNEIVDGIYKLDRNTFRIMTVMDLLNFKQVKDCVLYFDAYVPGISHKEFCISFGDTN